MSSDLERGWERELRLVRDDHATALKEIARLQLLIAEVVSNLQCDSGEPARICIEPCPPARVYVADDGAEFSTGEALPEDLWSALVDVAQDLERLLTTIPLGVALRELVDDLQPDDDDEDGG